MTQESITGPFDAVIYDEDPLFRKTTGGFESRHARAVKIFAGTVAEFDAYEQRLRDEAQAARDAAVQAARERDRARREAEPRGAGPVLGTPGAVLTSKRASDLDERLKDVESMEFTNVWLSYPAMSFGNEVWGGDDLILFAPGKKVHAWRDAKSNLVCFRTVDPNPRVTGAEPRRGYLVTEFDGDSARRINYLRQLDTARLIAVVLAEKLQAWWLVEHLSKSDLEKFFIASTDIGNNPKTGLGTFMAALPGSALSKPRDVSKRLKALGVACDKSLPDKAYLIYWDPNSLSSK